MASYTPYLHANEYALYGVANATVDQVQSATRLINGFIGKPEGLLWTPDANGMPCYMTCLSPTRSFTAPAIAPGSDVVVTIPKAQFGTQNIGDVVVLDRLTPSITEACVVTAASGNTLTLDNVQFDHPSPRIDFGLTIKEESPIQRGAPVVFAARRPVAQLFSMYIKYGNPKLPRQISDTVYSYDNLLINTLILGVWNPVDISTVDINTTTGALQVYPSFFPTNYPLLARINYVAGWSDDTLPTDIKQAAANIVNSNIQVDLPSNIKLARSGDATLESFSPSVLDPDTKALLQPYRSMRI